MRVTVAGGDDAAQWTAAFRGTPGVILRMCPAAAGALLDDLADADADAVALASPVADLGDVVRRYLAAGRHVFVAGPAMLGSAHLIALEAMARRGQRVLLFDDGAVADPHVAFARKMSGGDQALWRPRYIRYLRADPAAVTVDEAAVAALDTLIELTRMEVESMSCVAPSSADGFGIEAAMMSLLFADGLVAGVDVTTIEPEPRDEMRIVCDDRTIVLDRIDQVTPLRIQSARSHRGPGEAAAAEGGWTEIISERPPVLTTRRHTRVAEAFVSAVRARDVSATNARQMAVATRLWETARDSIARGGESVEVLPLEVEQEARPQLQLIKGGAEGHDDERGAPGLTVVR